MDNLTAAPKMKLSYRLRACSKWFRPFRVSETTARADGELVDLWYSQSFPNNCTVGEAQRIADNAALNLKSHLPEGWTVILAECRLIPITEETTTDGTS